MTHPRTLRELEKYVEDAWALQRERQSRPQSRQQRRAMTEVIRNLQSLTAKAAEIGSQAKEHGYGPDDVLPEKFPDTPARKT